jgi:hypothetical protein
VRPAWILLCAAGCRLGFTENTPPDAAAGLITPTALSVEWSTPHSVMWRFDWSGDETMLDHFELVIGASEDEVRFRDGLVVGPALRPELGFSNLPDAGSRVLHALAPATPGSTQWCQLVAYDKLGGATGSQLVKTLVPGVPSRQIVLYDDALLPGTYPFPDVMTETTDMPHRGQRALRFDSPCVNGECYENLRVQGYTAPLAAVASSVSSAYLELWIAPTGAPSYWSEARICLTDCGQPGLRSYSWITLRADAGYQRLEVPLRVMTDINDVPVTAADMMQPLFEWTIGGTWPLGATVHIDDVSIYY